MCVYLFIAIYKVHKYFAALGPIQRDKYIMVCIRRAKVEDLIYMQMTNLWCLPENYQVYTRCVKLSI